MSDITVTFKNETILTMDASGSKDLLTQGKYCEDDISISYVKPSGGGGISSKSFNFVADGSVSNSVPVDIDTSKILFMHFIDNDMVYPTAGATYEGFRYGPALTTLPELDSRTSWFFWRTSTGGSTGFNTYGSGTVIQEGSVNVATSPVLPAGHNCTLTCYYTD